METLVLVFNGMTSAFLTESCHSDQTKWKQSVPKVATAIARDLCHDEQILPQ